MLKRITLFTLILSLFALRAFATPTDDVKKTVDEVVRIVAAKDKNDHKRRQALKKSIGAMFDYREMSRRSLGKHWQPRTESEKAQFADLFAALLEKSYAAKIESYNNERIVYLKESVDADHAEVRSKVITAKRDEFTLDYRLLNEGGRWMVYDVVIEGVSLVSNYRSQFSKVIATSGYSGLISKLQAKHGEL